MIGALITNGSRSALHRLPLALACFLGYPQSLLAQETFVCNGSDYYAVRWVHSEFNPSPNKPVDEGKEEFAVEIRLVANSDGKTGIVRYEKTRISQQPYPPMPAKVSRDEFGFALTWTIDSLPSVDAISVFPHLAEANGVLFGTSVSISARMGNYFGNVRRLKCRRVK
jgi:hypothetical protein